MTKENLLVCFAADMKRMMTPPSDDSDVSDQRHPMKTRCAGGQGGDSPGMDPKKWITFKDLHDRVTQLLSTKLNPCNIKQCKSKLDILSKCSYYLEVMRQDTLHQPDPQQNYLSNSTILHLIDPWKFQRMKKLGHSQVQIQLSLLEELYEQFCKGKVEMEAIASQSDYGDQEVAHINGRIAHLIKAFTDFDSTLMPGELHTKHRLISETGNAKVPQIHLRLSVKMPVMFDTSRSEALADCARLHWEMAGQEQQEPGEQFEIRYKLLQPTNTEEGNQLGTVTCNSYCIQVNNLLPQRCYEFTVKRVDACCLVYGFWNDTMVLRTMPLSPGGFTGSQEKRRRLFPW